MLNVLFYTSNVFLLQIRPELHFLETLHSFEVKDTGYSFDFQSPEFMVRQSSMQYKQKKKK